MIFSFRSKDSGSDEPGKPYLLFLLCNKFASQVVASENAVFTSKRRKKFKKHQNILNRRSRGTALAPVEQGLGKALPNKIP